MDDLVPPNPRRFSRDNGYIEVVSPMLLYSHDGVLSGIGANWAYKSHACVLVDPSTVYRWRRYINAGGRDKYKLSALGWIGCAANRFWKQVRVAEEAARSVRRNRRHKKP